MQVTLQLVQSDQLPRADSYSQVVVASGKRLLFVAGQVAEDPQGNLIGRGGLASQARHAFANVGRALAAAGAAPENVARITIYVVHHKPEYLAAIADARMSVFGNHKPADALIGVEALAEPQYLIEIDAIAVVD
jgi:enamine deaminase RidA (YjgF/YER057c/UK114 family)